MSQSILRLHIPDTVQFSDLQLEFADGAIAFNWEPIEKICGHNGISADLFKHRPEDNVGDLIIHWYAAHRAAGGAIDPVCEEYFAEVLAEMQAGLIVDTPGTSNQ